MSRSHKKSPFTTWAISESNKKDKIIANRLFRRISKSNLRKEEEPLYSLKECSDVWNFNSDGLAYYYPKQYYENGERTDEEIDEIYRKQMSK